MGWWLQAGQRIWHFLTMLWANREDAVNAYHWVNRWLRCAIIAAFFELVIVAAVAGTVEPIWVKALIGVGLPALTILVPVILVPALVAAIWAIPRARRVLFWIITLVAIQSLYGIYLAFVPVSNNPGLLVLQVALMWVAVLLAWPARRYNLARGVQVALVAIVFVTTAAFYAGSYGKLGKKVGAIGNDAKAAAPRESASATSRAFCVKISLAGRNNWVGPIGITTHVEGEAGFIPGGWKWIAEGPPDARERGSDGQILGIYDPAPLPSGKTEFDGPAGGTIIVKVRPPDGAYINC